MKPMSNYEFWHLVFLANIDPTDFGSHDHLVSAVQRQGIIKKGWFYTYYYCFSAEGDRKERARLKENMDMEQSTLNRKDASNNALAEKSPRFDDDVL